MQHELFYLLVFKMLNLTALLGEGSTHVGQVQQIYANPQHKFLSLTALRRANDAIKLRISFQRLEAICRSSPKHADVGMQSNAP